MRRTPSFRSFRISFVVVLIPLSFSQRCALAWTALSRVGHGILSSQYYSNGSLEHLFASRGPRPIASIDEVCSPTFKPRTCRVILPSLARVIVQSLCNTEGSPSSAAAFAAFQWHLSSLLRNIYCRLITFRRSSLGDSSRILDIFIRTHDKIRKSPLSLRSRALVAVRLPDRRWSTIVDMQMHSCR
jgi:hypothetical protein